MQPATLPGDAQGAPASGVQGSSYDGQALVQDTHPSHGHVVHQDPSYAGQHFTLRHHTTCIRCQASWRSNDVCCMPGCCLLPTDRDSGLACARQCCTRSTVEFQCSTEQLARATSAALEAENTVELHCLTEQLARTTSLSSQAALWSKCSRRGSSHI